MKRALIAVAALLAAQAGTAEAVIGCYGQVLSIEFRSDGMLIGNWGFGAVGLCYLTADVSAAPSFTIKKEACTAVYSSFLTALASHQYMQAYISTSGTCAQALAYAPNQSGTLWPTVQPYGYQISGG